MELQTMDRKDRIDNDNLPLRRWKIFYLDQIITSMLFMQCNICSITPKTDVSCRPDTELKIDRILYAYESFMCVI